MSNRFQLTCECGAAYGVTPGQAGQELACTCGRTLAVPLLRELRSLPPYHDDATASRRADASAAPARSPLLFACILVTVLALLCTAALALARSRIDVSWSIEGQRSYDAVLIDGLGPDELYNAWHDLQHEGLGEKRPDSYMLNHELHARTSRLLHWSLIASAVFGGLSVAVGLAGRRGSGS
ncbi:MAG: hypothetical protein U0939_10030 [Pirellulales bacterium]